MSLNLDKIRAKLEALKSGEFGNSNSIIWRPKPGTHVVRTLPWPDMPDGEVYPERWFYYEITRGGCVVPDAFGEPDPVKDLRIKCYEDGRPEMRELAKKLHPRRKAYVPIIVRGEENLGVRLWAMSKTIHEEMLGYYLVRSLNPGPGGIADLEQGFDVDVTVEKPAGTDFYRTKTDVPRDREPTAAGSPEDVKKWMSELPNINEMYPCPSYEEVKNLVEQWFTRMTQSDMTVASRSAKSEHSSPVTEKAGASSPSSKRIDDVFDELDSLNGGDDD